MQDACGRTASCTQTFTISNVGPTIECAGNVVIECADEIVESTPVTTSSCGLENTVTTVGPTLVSGQADCDGAAYEIVYTVEDACGRTASCTQTFTISNVGPTIECAGDVIIECADEIVESTPVTTSSCGLENTVTTVGPTLVSGQADCDGAAYEIVYTVEDGCGRTA